MYASRTAALCLATAVVTIGAGCAPDTSPLSGAAPISTSRVATPSGQFVVRGAILTKYIEIGGASHDGPLGLPISNEQIAPNHGRYSGFQSGVIYWSPRSGAHVVLGDIRMAWEFNGGAGGPLGYPTSDRQPIPGGWRSDFQHGDITTIDGRTAVHIGG